MYTLYTSVTRSLPTTSYMKAIEWWLMFHIIIPFIIFIVLFLDEHIHKADKSDIQNVKMRVASRRFVKYFVYFGKFVLPAIISIFAATFAIIVLSHYS